MPSCHTMKKPVRSFFSFNRYERTGILALAALLVLLVLARLLLPWWGAGSHDGLKTTGISPKSAIAAKDSAEDKTGKGRSADDFQNRINPGRSKKLRGFPPFTVDLLDINSADSAALVQIAGLDPASAGLTVACRNREGPFKDLGKLERILHVSPKQLRNYKTHLVVRRE